MDEVTQRETGQGIEFRRENSADDGRWVTDPDDPEYQVWEAAPKKTENLESPRLGHMEVVWSDGRTPNPARICTATNRKGEPCRKTAIRGGNVCATHGGSTPQVKRAARVRLEMAADRMAKELLGIATDEDTPMPVRLAAIKDALDRAGVSAKTAVELEVTAKPFENVLDAVLTGGARAESRAARGIPDDQLTDPRWAEYVEDIVDAEVVEGLEPLEPPTHPSIVTLDQAHPEPPTFSRPGLVSMENAVSGLAARRRADASTQPPESRVTRARRAQ